MRIIALLIIFLLITTAAFAVTGEATATTAEAKKLNFWTEFDITFWQTVPFAAFWGYVAASQLSRGGEINWSPVMNFAVGVSVINAVLHARQAAK